MREAISHLDTVYRWQAWGNAFGAWESTCRLRIYRPHPEQVIVLVSDLGTDTGTRITNWAEQLATRIVRDYFLDPQTLTWIEHYPGTEPEFSRVVFTWRGRKASHPRWSYLAPQTVQAMIGHPL